MALPRLKASRGRGTLELLQIKDFAGGWNPRDAPSELAPNESPDCINVTLDERGGVVKRLGLLRLGSGSALSNAPTNSFFFASEGRSIVQDGATVKWTTDFTTFTNIKTFSNSALVVFVDFKEKLIMCHPVDGIFSWSNSGGVSARLGAPVKGVCMTVWQNKIWVGGDASNPSRVWWSNAGDETIWTVGTDFVDVREVDGAVITAIGSGQQMDVTAKPTLLVFKRNATHRINDSTSGSYTTMSTSEGCCGPLALTNLIGRTFFAGPKGVYATDGISAPVNVSSKLEPLFMAQQLNYSRLNQWCMGTCEDRVLLSLPRTGSNTNNMTLEYNPAFGWIVPHSFGISSFMRYNLNTELCYGTSSTAGKIFQVFATGSDDGTAIDSRYQSRWIQVNAGHEAQMRRIIIEGRGNFDLYVKKNYTISQGELNPVQIGGGGFLWGTDLWDDAGTPWGPSIYEDFESFYQLGVSRSVSFLMKHSGTTSATAPKLLQDGASAEVGAFACYAIDLEYVRLGYA
jgi:hypothetical protein